MQVRRLFVLLMAVLLLSGCAQSAVQAEEIARDAYVNAIVLTADIEEEAIALAESPAAVPALLVPKASGTKEKRVTKAVIDYSNTDDGYVMVQFTGKTTKRLKAQVKGTATTYTYNLTPGQW